MSLQAGDASPLEMTTSLTNRIPVELWDEIFSFTFLLTYPSVFDFTSPFHGVFNLRRINDFDLHQWRRLSRSRTRLRLVCKKWNNHILYNLRWVHRISPRARGLTATIPCSPIAVLHCEDCSLDAIRMTASSKGVHIRSLHIHLENFGEPTRGLVDMAKSHMPNLATLSIHIDWESQPLMFCDISDQLPHLKALSISAGRQTGRLGLHLIEVPLATSPLLSLGGVSCSMPSLEILDLPSNSQEILNAPSQLCLPKLRHLYGRGMDILKSQTFLNQFGHQLCSLGLYGSREPDCRVTYEEFFQYLPKMTLLAVDFRVFHLLGAPPPTLGHLDTLVHLGPVYSDLLNNPLVLKFMESGWSGSNRTFRMSDVWLPSPKSEVRTEWIKKHTLHYSRNEREMMMSWVSKFRKAGVRLEDMEGLTYAEALRPKGEVAN